MNSSSCSCSAATPGKPAPAVPSPALIRDECTPLCVALGVVRSGTTDVYSRAFQVMPGNSVVLAITMVNNDGFGEVRAEFQGAGAVTATFQTTGPAAVAVTSPGETKSVMIGPTGFPILRVRFFSPTSNVGVVNASVRAFRA